MWLTRREAFELVVHLASPRQTELKQKMSFSNLILHQGISAGRCFTCNDNLVLFSKAVGSGRDDGQEMKVKISKLEEDLNVTRSQVQKLMIELQTQRKAMENLTVQVNIILWLMPCMDITETRSFSTLLLSAGTELQLLHRSTRSSRPTRQNWTTWPSRDPRTYWPYGSQWYSRTNRSSRL